MEKARIDWTHPKPRPNLWDYLLGPGYTRAEFWMTWVFGLFAGVAIALYAGGNLDWTLLQFIVAVSLMVDLAGGVVANATSSAKRWWHGPSRGLAHHLVFVGLHVHPFVIAWLFRQSDWSYGTSLYLYLVASTLLIGLAPVYLRRPLSLALVGSGVLLETLIWGPVAGLHWFVPFYLLKLLLAHVVPEEPYRPDWERPH